jgi:3-hydroxyisobutyrate dehydrogenase
MEGEGFMDIKKIGFIGTGVMGKSMAENLFKAGFVVSVYTRTKEKAEDLIMQGIGWEESAAILASKSDVIISMVGYPKDVEDVYLGRNGVLKAAAKGSYIVDMTTSSPTLAQRLSAAAGKIGLSVLDAPVSGGDVGARDAKLAIMVGGEEADYKTLLPVFKAMGTNIQYFGKAGSGQYAKMSNQIAIASNMIGVCEALAYAKKCGLDPQKLLATISTGAAGSWSLSNLAPRMVQEDYTPGFFIKHFIKDMRIAITSADEMKLDLPGLKLAKKLYTELVTEGCGDDGTQALIKWYLKQ